MIDQHIIDKESFARENTLESMKENMFLKHGDTVLVALGEGGYGFYNIVKDPNVVELNNGLFAVLERDKRRYDKDEIDRIVEDINAKFKTEADNDQIHEQLKESIQALSGKLSEKAGLIHNHKKADITDFPTSLPNPYTLTIINGVNRVTYNGEEDKEITITAGGFAPEAHKHNATDVLIDKEHQFVSVIEKDRWNNKSDISHNHDDRYRTTEEITVLLNGKSDSTHTHNASSIRVDNDRSFISSAEREKWNNKSDKDHIHQTLTIRNGVNTITYDGSQSKEIFIDASGSAPAQHRHNANDIEQDSGHRFVTDLEKKSWDSKANNVHSHNSLTIKNGDSIIVYDGTTDKSIEIAVKDKAPLNHRHSATDIDATSDLNFVSRSEKYTWNSKADANHKHNATDITTDDTHQFITATDRNNWNNKANYHEHPYLSTNGGTINGSVTVNGDLRANRVYNAVWNDYAEFFERGEKTEPGDLISLDCSSDKEQYIKASLENPVLVGVHSDSFAHLIGGKETSFEENLKEFIPVGLAGRVKCKVIGKVLKGQYIGLSNLPGIGATVDYLNPYIVGIALEDKLTEGLGIVKILIK